MQKESKPLSNTLIVNDWVRPRQPYYGAGWLGSIQSIDEFGTCVVQFGPNRGNTTIRYHFSNLKKVEPPRDVLYWWAVRRIEE